MISNIKAVADLLTQFFSGRKENREHLLKEVITPAYETTIELVDASREIIRRSIKAANTPEQKDFDECIDSLKRVRKSYITECQSISAMAETAVSMWVNDALSEFAKDLKSVFFDDIHGMYLGASFNPFEIFRSSIWQNRTRGWSALEFLDAYKEGDITKECLLERLEIMIHILNWHWEKLSSAYAQLKVPKA